MGVNAGTMKKGLVVASWLCLVAALLALAFVLFAIWAVNADALGGKDLGLALALGMFNWGILVGSVGAIPVLVVAAAFTLRIHARSGWRFLAASAVCAVSLAAYAWLG
jgi:hypothetical protein